MSVLEQAREAAALSVTVSNYTQRGDAFELQQQLRRLVEALERRTHDTGQAFAKPLADIAKCADDLSAHSELIREEQPATAGYLLGLSMKLNLTAVAFVDAVRGVL